MVLLFKPVKEKKQYFYESIVEQIKSLILEGRLQPGDKLPSERELTNVFGVSRSCIREACKTLSTLGFVHVVHGQGMFVADPGEGANLLQLANQALIPCAKVIQDLFELRKLLEPNAAAWAAIRRTDSEAVELWKTVHAMRDKTGLNIMQLWDHDTKFHLSIALATHNQVVVRSLSGILDFMAESRKKTLLTKERPFRSLEEHAEIARCILTGDGEAARQAMNYHLINVEADIAHL